eukprot:6498542-Prymnesium_polylepis.1
MGTPPPAAAAACCAPSAVRHAWKTVWPSPTSLRAAARPIPLLLPVMAIRSPWADANRSSSEARRIITMVAERTRPTTLARAWSTNMRTVAYPYRGCKQ